MNLEVEYTDEFGERWSTLAQTGKEHLSAAVELPMTRGSQPGLPHSSGVHGSCHSDMRALRIPIGGRPIRIIHAFDPRQTATLLTGGDKTGNARFSQQYVPVVDRLCGIYLRGLRHEGFIP